MQTATRHQECRVAVVCPHRHGFRDTVGEHGEAATLVAEHLHGLVVPRRRVRRIQQRRGRRTRTEQVREPEIGQRVDVPAGIGQLAELQGDRSRSLVTQRRADRRAGTGLFSVQRIQGYATGDQHRGAAAVVVGEEASRPTPRGGDHSLDRGGSERGQVPHAGQHHLETFRSEQAVTVGQSAVERPTTVPQVTRGPGIGRLGDHPDRQLGAQQRRGEIGLVADHEDLVHGTCERGEGVDRHAPGQSLADRIRQ